MIDVLCTKRPEKVDLLKKTYAECLSRRKTLEKFNKRSSLFKFMEVI